MMTPEEVGALFRDLLNEGEDFSLACSALYISALEYPHLDIDAYLEQLNEYAEGAKALLSDALLPVEKALRLSRFLFIEEGFRGDILDYYNPKNCYLNEVMDRKLGIPITLSLIYLEIGWRLGLPVYGVGMPGHFLVGWAGDPPFYVDCFYNGILLNSDACRERFHQIQGEGVPFDARYLRPVSKREILLRILNNLKYFYAYRRNFRQALKFAELLVLLAPDSVQDLAQLLFLRSLEEEI